MFYLFFNYNIIGAYLLIWEKQNQSFKTLIGKNIIHILLKFIALLDLKVIAKKCINIIYKQIKKKIKKILIFYIKV
jgi:hypothetical protein